MKTKVILFWILFLVASATALAQDFLAKKVVQLDEEVPDFELSDTTGNPVRLSALRGKHVMVHFWSATCPFVVRYEDRIQAIVSDYGDRDVVVLGIDSNVNETPDEIRGVAHERGLNYSILLDPDQTVADQFGAITTPHVFLIDRNGVLVYEGSIDDQGWSERNPVTKHYAREAIEAVLSEKPVSDPQTKPFGCTVKRPLT